ncbi:unnamed protein product [Auanema sp. JU1783]|nr:unnamed protein product [Auanema sp. JU1783]
MILRTLLILFSLYAGVSSLNCYSCGVFLSAPTDNCKGAPTETVCDPDHLGCVSISGKNTDGTYYVERRCADPRDDLTQGCQNIAIHGIKATQCLCDYDYCNGSNQNGFLLSLTFTSLMLMFCYA